MSTTMNGSTKTTPSSTFTASRPSTNVPPATQAFEPLATSVLSDRIFSIFAYSAQYSLDSTLFLASRHDTFFLFRIFRPSTWINASLTWLVGVLPIIMVRMVFLALIPEPASSRSKMVAAALAKPAMRLLIAVYITSSLLVLSVEYFRIWSKSEDMRLSIFIHSSEHPYSLNGRLVYIVLAQIWLSISFALRSIVFKSSVIRWAKVQPPSNAPFVSNNRFTLGFTITLFTLSSFTVYNIAFGLARLIPLPLLLRVPIVRSLLEPFVGHFVTGPWTLTLPFQHGSLQWHAFMLGVFTLANWEFAEALCDFYIPQPVEVASTTADPNVTLVSGITSLNLLNVHSAYAELRDIGASRRTALFSDQRFSPSLWNTLAHESLLRLWDDYQTFHHRGAPATLEELIPGLFRSTSSPPVAAGTPYLFNAYVSHVKAQCQNLVVQSSPLWCRVVAREWDVWWSRDRIDKVVENRLPNRDLDALIVEVLAGLVCASLTEDRHGVVQRDVPRILEAFLSFLIALEEYQVEVTKLYVPPTHDEIIQWDFKVLREKERTRVEVAKATEAIGIIADPLRSGIANIAWTFGEKLVAFKFPPRIAQKLQSFVDYA